MGYAEKNLAPSETIVYRARYHWIYYGIPILLLVLAALLGLASLYAMKVSPQDDLLGRAVSYLALVFLVLAGASFLIRRIRASADEYVITNRRVIRKFGLIAREVEQAPLEKIQDITIRQSVPARLLGYGTVVLETASETGRIVFPRIAAPESLRTALWGEVRPAAPGVFPAVPMAAPAIAHSAARERLAELEELRTRGLVSPEEYAAKRGEILNTL